MAKNDNLKDFLIDVADAIREKKGTTEPINPQDFASEIASIETGGGMVADAPIKDVNFYDYDGTRLYSYSWDEIVAMTELPPLPTRKGLICEGWNYTLEQIKEQPYKKADVGAIYNTSDGKTRFYISVLKPNERVGVRPSISNGGVDFIIDWGDGTNENVSANGGWVYHDYLNEGDYVITVGNESRITLTDSGSKAFSFSSSFLRKVECGNNLTINYQGLQNDRNLKSISVSSTSHLDYTCFSGCLSLEAYMCKSGVRPSNMLFYESGIQIVSIAPMSGTQIIGEYTFYNCKALRRVCIPMGVTSINNRAFYGSGIMCVYIPPSVLSIATYAFNSCDALRELDFSHHTSIPTLGSNALPSSSLFSKIIVPDELYDEWIATSDWKNYASKIVKASEQ